MDDNNTNKEENSRAIKPPLGIFIVSPPIKTTYVVGESFDPTGMVVKANYADGTNQIVTLYLYSPNGPLTTSDINITISYLGKTATQPITVYPLPYLLIDHLPNKTTYIEGDDFEPFGMVVKYYNSGSLQTITNYSISASAPLTTNDDHITISYNGLTATVPITVNNPPSTGYFPIQTISGSNLGNNPFFNVFDQSIRFVSDTISVSRDSYALSFNLIYHSGMQDKLYSLNNGLPKRFKNIYGRKEWQTDFRLWLWMV